MDSNVKLALTDFLKALGYTDNELEQMTDDQLACVAFEEACDMTAVSGTEKETLKAS